LWTFSTRRRRCSTHPLGQPHAEVPPAAPHHAPRLHPDSAHGRCQWVTLASCSCPHRRSRHSTPRTTLTPTRRSSRRHAEESEETVVSVRGVCWASGSRCQRHRRPCRRAHPGCHTVATVVARAQRPSRPRLHPTPSPAVSPTCSIQLRLLRQRRFRHWTRTLRGAIPTAR
jgi:hypothetical protein